ncbi:MAG TPA: hypothetical protein DCW90_14970 [Lachnospiraceae bacterium]|nr:hypothetical protein [uncultured Lachnoclostridium sp.]HAU86737.1 hypothetical protein [Lachnospiraceae bacterium]
MIVKNEQISEINLAFTYKNEQLNAVLHSSFNLQNPYLTIIVPGVLGDRGDSRAMFTRIARKLCIEGFSVLRFDFYGGGSNLGDYCENDFALFAEQLNTVTEQVLSSFGYMKKIIFICFSEGLKFAFHVAEQRDDVVGLISCNGLCVEESIVDKINRPRIRNERLVYDSDLGTWISWSLVEQYKDYFVDAKTLEEDTKYFGIYSTADIYSQNSKEFWISRNWPYTLIDDADHLYTKELWVRELIDSIVKWHQEHIELPRLGTDTEKEFFLQGKRKTCIKLIEHENESRCILFIHGLFQNKSGPGFLFTQIMQQIKGKYNICMFDFPASGDSDGSSEELNFESMQEVLVEVVSYLKKIKPDVRITAIASGTGNILLSKNKELFESVILLFPEQCDIWGRLDENMREKEVIDTSDFYDTYEWAEEQCCVMGNIRNRSKGITLQSSFIRQISEFNVIQMLHEYDGYAFVNRKEYVFTEKSEYIDDRQGLVMSARKRDKLIGKIISILEGDKYD